MGIETRIRAVLEVMEFHGEERRIYALMVKAALGGKPQQEFGNLDDLFAAKGEGQWVREAFREVGYWRTLLGFSWRGYAVRRFTRWRGNAQRMMEREVLPVEALWMHWMLAVGEKEMGMKADRGVLRRLWERGFSEQQGDGRLLMWDADGAIEGFVFDELCGIHAAYNAAKAIGDAGMMEQVRRVVRWHVENTQPDNTTNEPWGLAAFAALDETGTFAEQQLQDAVVQLRNGSEVEGRVPVSVGLLADAVMTMENEGRL